MPASIPVAARKVVLLVEDNVDALDIYSSSLRFAGYDVVEAPTLEDAKLAVERRRPDVVVLDCRLPDGDGLLLLESWRHAGASMREVPVIVVTAHVVRQDVEAALLAGADVFVPKPCSGAELALHVARSLDGRKPSARLRRPLP